MPVLDPCYSKMISFPVDEDKKPENVKVFDLQKRVKKEGFSYFLFHDIL